MNLVPDEDEDFLGYFGNGWDKAIKSENIKYILSDEHEFLFIFIHFARHFHYGGIGYRQLTDLWIYQRTHPDLDLTFIEREIDTLNIRHSYNNTMKTVDACFKDGLHNEETDIISDYIFNSGNWGSMYSVSVAQNIKKCRTAALTAKI